jgi:hypothetical protein
MGNARNEKAPEQRTAVMVLVEATWQDQSGTLQKSRACMINRSHGGACIRLRRAIAVGTKLRVQWRWDQFTGITRYCRSEGRDFLVGVQKESEQHVTEHKAEEKKAADERVTESKHAAERVLPQEVLAQAVERRSLETQAAMWGGARWEEKRVQEVAPEMQTEQSGLGQTNTETKRLSESVSKAEPSRSPAEFLLQALGTSAPRASTGKTQESAGSRGTKSKEKPRQEAQDGRKERKHMARKWFDMGQKTEMQDNANSNGAGIPVISAEPLQPGANAIAERKTKVREAEEAAASIELLSMADIYQNAGILNPRKGYSILKVVEMLHSEHLRGLPSEMKRTTVLVALDAAGITLDEVSQDAKARTEAIDSYEAEQRKQFETLLARKADENQQIMAELERVKASYAERMRRNLEGVSREKATFGNWLTTKQQEAQSIAEALELILKTETIEPVAKAGGNGLLSSPAKTV